MALSTGIDPFDDDSEPLHLELDISASMPNQPLSRPPKEGYATGLVEHRSSRPPPGSNRPGRRGAPSSALPFALRPQGASEPASFDDALTLAGYGPAPVQPWLLPWYAYRVHLRQSELARELVLREAEESRTGAAADEALVALAERALSNSVDEPRSARLRAAVDGARAALRSRDTVLVSEMDRQSERLAEMDAGRTVVEHAIAELQAAEKTVSDKVVALEHERQRAEARMKRIDIELRNLRARAEAAADDAGLSGLPGTPESNAELAEGQRRVLLSERESWVADVRRIVAEVDPLHDRMMALRKGLAEKHVQRTEGHRRRLAEGQTVARRIGPRSAAVEEAKGALRDALIAFGRMVVAENGLFGADLNADRAVVSDLEHKASIAAGEADLYRTALSAHDASAVRRGIGWGIAMAVTLLALFSLPFALRLWATLSGQEN